MEQPLEALRESTRRVRLFDLILSAALTSSTQTGEQTSQFGVAYESMDFQKTSGTQTFSLL